MAHEEISPSEDARECVRTVCCHDAGVLVDDNDGGGCRLTLS